MNVTRIIVMAKAPVAGLAKTRLIAALGAEGTAALARRMLVHALQQAVAAGVGPVELCVTPAPTDPVWEGCSSPKGIEWTSQLDGDLGARMAEPAEKAIARGEHVMLVGTDCPQLDATRLRQAASDLDHSDVVMHPTVDGGYALLALRRFDARLFSGMPWSTPLVSTLTLERIHQIGWSVTIGKTLRDIDEPSDLAYLPPSWKALSRTAGSGSDASAVQ
jgi:rSAM/selenodomain-associated transferase 1